jgi:lipid-binding SYLF domain-containing protein
MNKQGSFTSIRNSAAAFLLICCITLIPFEQAFAATAKEIDTGVEVALERFAKEVKGGKEFLDSAKGVLVFPDVYKGGLGIGGQYGEGALLTGGKTMDYYNTVSASFGFQAGGQVYTLIFAFMQQEALEKFRQSKGWEVGVDASVALIKVGAGKPLNTMNIKDPIVAFVLGQKGLMFDLSLQGTKITKLDKTKK